VFDQLRGAETMTTTEQNPSALDGRRPTESVADEVTNTGRGAQMLGNVARPDARVSDTRTERQPGRPRGVEVRVHGIGDHATYSALGTPRYKELVDSRVWIGQLPEIPPHRLRLVNWSRANRQITRHLSWYLAFPFTLLNVAGYMEGTHKGARTCMRIGIAAASLCMTIATAAWITVISETAWRAFVPDDDRLTGVVLQGVGPALLILFIVYRMFVGRVLVDRAGSAISVASIVALIALVFYLHAKPSWQSQTWFLHKLLVWDDQYKVDAMTAIVALTTEVVLVVAVVLCVIALWKKKDIAAFAGAALLLVIAIALLHTAGSMIRLFISTFVRFMPNSLERFDPNAVGGPLRPQIPHVLLPVADDFTVTGISVVTRNSPLRIDLIPIFFVAMLLVCAIVFWIQLWRQQCKHRPEPGAPRPTIKRATRTHDVVMSLPHDLPPAVALAIGGTVGVWALLYWASTGAPYEAIAVLLVVLQVAGAVTIVMIIIRRPEKLAEQLRKTFGSIADIAGFWAPDLHPLAGASYRRALLSGIRQTVNDVAMEYPHHPVALVGHSQGSVICAWFMRGGHWMEQPSECTTDRQAIKDGMYRSAVKPSERIALFTCGSPLATLYQTFFPRYFDDQFFSRTAEMTFDGDSWRNYWRATDPIGSELPAPCVNRNVTEDIDEATLGHSEYWKEDDLRSDIRNFFNSASIEQRQPEPSAERCVWCRS
jgi:hypothetical protein